MNIIGIDPGLNGGIAKIYNNSIWRVVPMPTMPSGKKGGRCLDLADIAGMLDDYGKSRAYVEKATAMPKQGVTSMFSFGVGYGQLLGILAALKIPYEIVHPKHWQKIMLAGQPKGDTKASSIAVCKRLFPGIDLRRSERCTKDHDGMADALLIAEYGRRINHE